jgi:hypothetical protein
MKHPRPRIDSPRGPRPRPGTTPRTQARSNPVPGSAPAPPAPPPSPTDPITTVLAAGILGIYSVQQALFGGQPVPPAGKLLLDLARAQLSFGYQVLRLGVDALDQIVAAQTAAHQQQQPPPTTPAPGPGKGP